MGIMYNIVRGCAKPVVRPFLEIYNGKRMRRLLYAEGAERFHDTRRPFRDIFDGKKVCLVGPAPYLKGSGAGAFIDSFDLVCRINLTFLIKHKEDYGARNDILFASCNPLILTTMKAEAHAWKDFRYVINPITDANSTFDTEPEQDTKLERSFQAVNVNKTPYYDIPADFYRKACDITHVRLNTGALAVLYIMTFDILKLHITGFSFYTEIKNYTSYDYDTVSRRYAFDYGLVHKHCTKPTGEYLGIHNQDLTVDCFKRHILTDRRVTVDDYMRDILRTRRRVGHKKPVAGDR
jgi:hypothetical protein